MAVRILLLGGARLVSDDKPVSGRAAQRRRIAVLALLVRAPRRTLTRERVLAYLWPEHPPEAARRLLSEAVYVLRRELGDQVIAAVGDELTLDRTIGCDVDDFLVEASRGDHARAVECYTGPFLDGWFVRDAPEFDRWMEAERVELATTHLHALRCLTEQREAAGDWLAAAAGWQSIVRLDPYGSTAVLRAARALVAAGETASALNTLKAHRELLATEFGVEPDNDLKALERDIKEGRVRTRRPSTSTEPSLIAPVVGPMAETVDPPPEIPPTSQPTEHTHGDSASPAVQSNPINETASAIARRRLGLLAASVVVIVTALGAWFAASPDGPASAAQQPSTAAPSLDPRRIAVLYFDDQSANRSLRYLADGLTEELIRELSDVPTLRVLSPDATRRFGSSMLPPDSVGRTLGAGTIIGATLRESAGRIRLLARIIDAGSGEQVATVAVEQPRGELFALEDSLAARTAAALRIRLGDAVRLHEARRAAMSGRRDNRALELVLRAERIRKEAEAVRMEIGADTAMLTATRARLGGADSMLAIADSIDPSWGRPAIERGWVAVTSARLEHGNARVMALWPALGHAVRALTILSERAPMDVQARARALYLRGFVRVHTATAVQTFRPQDEMLNAAESDLRLAVQLDGTLAGAWAALSLSHWLRGDFAGAQKAAVRALAADTYLENSGEVLGWAWRSAYFLTDRAEAMRWCERGRTLHPSDWHFLECELTIARLDAAGLSGRRPDEKRAWELVRALERADPEPFASRAGRPYSPIYRRLVAAAIAAAAGQRDSARRVLARETARVKGDQELATDALYDMAFLQLTLGDTSRASSSIRSYLRARPDLESLVESDSTMRAAMQWTARTVSRGATTGAR
jgi:DNA-binding SARP family transcriptional activator/TolB-like protein